MNHGPNLKKRVHIVAGDAVIDHTIEIEFKFVGLLVKILLQWKIFIEKKNSPPRDNHWSLLPNIRAASGGAKIATKQSYSLV